MEKEEVLQLMQGNYVRLSKFGPTSDEFANVVENDTISFRTGLIVDPRSKWNTVAFTLEKNVNLTSFEAWDIKLDPEFAGHNESIFHTEDVDGHQVRFISDMGFEHDGRGRIVISTKVHEADKPYVTDEFETKLYDRYNNTKPVPQMNPFFGGAMPSNTMGMMGMEMAQKMFMNMNQGMPMGMPNQAASDASATEETVTCPACKMQVKKARFCGECGNPLK